MRRMSIPVCVEYEQRVRQEDDDEGDGKDGHHAVLQRVRHDVCLPPLAVLPILHRNLYSTREII